MGPLGPWGGIGMGFRARLAHPWGKEGVPGPEAWKRGMAKPEAWKRGMAKLKPWRRGIGLSHGREGVAGNKQWKKEIVDKS